MWPSTSIKHRGDNLVAAWQRLITFVSRLLPCGNNAILFPRNLDFFADKMAFSQQHLVGGNIGNSKTRQKVITVPGAFAVPKNKNVNPGWGWRGMILPTR
jgi:hypothetical protein